MAGIICLQKARHVQLLGGIVLHTESTDNLQRQHGWPILKKRQ
jgi:hypothetical protein